MKGTLRPIDGAEMARMNADARRVTVALLARMLYEIHRTRQLVKALDASYSDWIRISHVDEGDFAELAWEHFTNDLSKVTDMAYEWEWAEHGTWDERRG